MLYISGSLVFHRTEGQVVNMFIGMLIGVIAGGIFGAVAGGFRYVLAAGQSPPYGRRRSPLQNYLSWCQRPVLMLLPIGAAAGALIGLLVS